MAQVKAVPQGLHTVTPALALDGCAEAIEWLERALGAEEVMRAPDPSGKKIWHAAIRIGDSQLFVNDVFPEMGAVAKPGRLWIYTDHVDELWARATSAGGATVRMPLGDMFWGDRMGTFEDRWGNEWTLAQRIKDMTPAEMQAAQDQFVAGMKK